MLVGNGVNDTQAPSGRNVKYHQIIFRPDGACVHRIYSFLPIFRPNGGLCALYLFVSTNISPRWGLVCFMLIYFLPIFHPDGAFCLNLNILQHQLKTLIALPFINFNGIAYRKRFSFL